ncbi:MAG: hypothetical protein LBT68_01560 [Spirochaetales bacterium]|jgi:hypothetical protein|nr:hypothetical protein [Spirochaetales bacterium]
MLRRLLALAVFVCLCCAPHAPSAFAEDENKSGFFEWFKTASLLLGTNLEDAFQSFGVPLRVGAARGEASWQDDVYFEYEGGFFLFWYKDRVWQLRFGPGFDATFSDVGMGSSREEIIAVLGKPLHDEDDWILYHYAGQGYPVRLRLFFGETGLEDIYIFRGDF